MKQDYEIDITGKKEEIPSKQGARRDYAPILKSAATLSKGEFVKIDSTDGKDFSQALKNRLKKRFPSTSFRVTQRTYKNSDKISFYIIRES